MIGEPGAHEPQRRMRRRVDHQVGLHQVVERVGAERSRECAEIVAQAVVDPREVGVRIHRDPLLRRRAAAAAHQRADRVRVAAARRRDQQGQSALERFEHLPLR